MQQKSTLGRVNINNSAGNRIVSQNLQGEGGVNDLATGPKAASGKRE